jgi:predicted HicB family RNase H-like nuclease
MRCGDAGVSVLGSRAIISFHGEAAAELRSAFEAAIENFLRDCKQVFSDPD